MNAQPEGKTKIPFSDFRFRSLTPDGKRNYPLAAARFYRKGSEVTSTGTASGESGESASNLAPGLLKPRFT
jgi:hypothetical protein